MGRSTKHLTQGRSHGKEELSELWQDIPQAQEAFREGAPGQRDEDHRRVRFEKQARSVARQLRPGQDPDCGAYPAYARREKRTAHVPRRGAATAYGPARPAARVREE